MDFANLFSLQEHSICGPGGSELGDENTINNEMRTPSSTSTTTTTTTRIPTIISARSATKATVTAKATAHGKQPKALLLFFGQLLKGDNICPNMMNFYIVWEVHDHLSFDSRSMPIDDHLYVHEKCDSRQEILATHQTLTKKDNNNQQLQIQIFAHENVYQLISYCRDSSCPRAATLLTLKHPPVHQETNTVNFGSAFSASSWVSQVELQPDGFEENGFWGCVDLGGGFNQSWLSQCPTFKLLGITYLVGNVEFKLLFHCPLAE